jgi:hypothetical protein
LAAFFIAHYVEGNPPFTPGTIFTSFESAVTANALAIGVFITWAWRLRIFHGWLVVVYDLSGCWTGTIKPLSNDESESESEHITAVANVRQSLFRVSVIVWTRKLQSVSFASEIYCDDDSGEQRLTYSYRADPDLSNRDANPAHEGTARLIVLSGARRLSGKYWTDRLTRGMIELTKCSAKECSDPKTLLLDLGAG